MNNNLRSHVLTRDKLLYEKKRIELEKIQIDVLQKINDFAWQFLEILTTQHFVFALQIKVIEQEQKSLKTCTFLPFFVGERKCFLNTFFPNFQSNIHNVMNVNLFVFKKRGIEASEFPRRGYTATTARSLGPTIKSISKAWLPPPQKMYPPSNTKMSQYFLIAVTESEGFTHEILAMAG